MHWQRLSHSILIIIEYQNAFCQTIWNDVWSHKRWEIEHHKIQHLLGQSKDWIFCVSLATCTCNVLHSWHSHISQRIECKYINYCNVHDIVCCRTFQRRCRWVWPSPSPQRDRPRMPVTGTAAPSGSGLTGCLQCNGVMNITAYVTVCVCIEPFRLLRSVSQLEEHPTWSPDRVRSPSRVDGLPHHVTLCFNTWDKFLILTGNLNCSFYW